MTSAARAILVDTSAYFVLADRSDRHHAAAVGFVQTNDRPLVTTDLIVIETLNLVQARLEPASAIALGKRLLAPAATTALKITDPDLAQACRLFQRFRDKAFSFTDCTTFALMARVGLSTAFAFDIHFRQYGRLIELP